jgi:hypothetical protein
MRPLLEPLRRRPHLFSSRCLSPTKFSPGTCAGFTDSGVRVSPFLTGSFLDSARDNFGHLKERKSCRFSEYLVQLRIINCSHSEQRVTIVDAEQIAVHRHTIERVDPVIRSWQSILHTGLIFSSQTQNRKQTQIPCACRAPFWRRPWKRTFLLCVDMTRRVWAFAWRPAQERKGEIKETR